MAFEAGNLRRDEQEVKSKTGLDEAATEQQVAQASEHREMAGHTDTIQVRLDDGNDMVCPVEAS